MKWKLSFFSIVQRWKFDKKRKLFKKTTKYTKHWEVIFQFQTTVFNSFLFHVYLKIIQIRKFHFHCLFRVMQCYEMTKFWRRMSVKLSQSKENNMEKLAIQLLVFCLLYEKIYVNNNLYRIIFVIFILFL